MSFERQHGGERRNTGPSQLSRRLELRVFAALSWPFAKLGPLESWNGTNPILVQDERGRLPKGLAAWTRRLSRPRGVDSSFPSLSPRKRPKMSSGYTTVLCSTPEQLKQAMTIRVVRGTPLLSRPHELTSLRPTGSLRRRAKVLNGGRARRVRPSPIPAPAGRPLNPLPTQQGRRVGSLSPPTRRRASRDDPVVVHPFRRSRSYVREARSASGAQESSRDGRGEALGAGAREAYREWGGQGGTKSGGVGGGVGGGEFAVLCGR